MDQKNIHLELKSLADDGTFEGSLAVYGNVDDGGDVIQYGAMRKTLAEGGARRPLLWQHNQQEPIGVLNLVDTPTALLASGKLVLAVPRAKEAYELLRVGALTDLSIGYKAVKQIIGKAGERILTEIRLFEGSLVTVGMNSAAKIRSVKTVEPDADMEAVEAVRNLARDLKQFRIEMTAGR